MSSKGLQEFIIDSRKDKKLKGILEKSRKKFASKEERFENISQEAKKFGYDFTVDDMLQEMEKSSIVGFSDDDLLGVSGGGPDGGSSSPSPNLVKNFMTDIIGKSQ